MRSYGSIMVVDKNETFYNFERIFGTCTGVLDIDAWLCGLAEEDM
jgi:hypothetical protein